MHEWICAAFKQVNVAAELAMSCRRAGAGQCFAGHEKFDVLWHGQKIAGAAERRTRNGLLIQGSLQPPPGSPARADWEKAMCEAAENEEGVEWMKFESDAPVRSRAAELVRQKYSQPGYNQKR